MFTLRSSFERHAVRTDNSSAVSSSGAVHSRRLHHLASARACFNPNDRIQPGRERDLGSPSGPSGEFGGLGRPAAVQRFCLLSPKLLPFVQPMTLPYFPFLSATFAIHP
jgi:hypothetical protein